MTDIWYWFSNLLWAAVGGFLGSLIALRIAKFQQPRFRTSAGEEFNDDITYPQGHPAAGQRWKFFRVRVTNKPVAKWLAWIVQRETAQQVGARITFAGLNRTMKGRWAGTLELPQASPLDLLRLANFPDPVTITAGSSEILDIFVQHGEEAYGWNNEAYLFNWKTPHYKLFPGDHRVDVEVTSVTGSQGRFSFKAHIDNRIDKTHLSAW
jgi:hypothetical protein